MRLGMGKSWRRQISVRVLEGGYRWVVSYTTYVALLFAGELRAIWRAALHWRSGVGIVVGTSG